MLDTFLATLNPMLTLFICIAVGFILRKTNILGDGASTVLAKLENWVFVPALNFSAMAQYFKVQTLISHASNLIFSSLSLAVSVVLTLILVGFFIKDKHAYETGVYKYALTFANSGYMGDPIILAIFGISGLSFYKIVTLPMNILTYSWGLNLLVPKGEKKQSFIKNLVNAPMLGMLLGIIAGLTGLGDTLSLPSLAFLSSVIDSLKSCMGPVAMLIAGLTIANFNLKKTFTNLKVYILSFLRLVLIPIIVIGSVFALKELANLFFSLSVDNSILYLLFFTVATPMGMNTIVFPQAFGGDATLGASMTAVSHTLCIISIPLMYALLTLIFGTAPIF